jgi:FtsP/CotA-like multicopper oxidase with cupredoxin domain
MQPLSQLVSRRRFLVGTAAAFACFGLAPQLRAETASDGFRLLRAGPLRTGGEAQSPASISSYDGAVPGPTLRLKRGEELRVRLLNELAEPTSVHWHGVRVPNAMDGVPLLTQPAVAPGASFDYRFRPPDAGTFWYHAFVPGQLDIGLHGALIVEELEPIDVDRDTVLVFGRSRGPGGAPILVNGSVRPDIPVKSGERLRLRLINATSTSGFALRFEQHSPWVMAVDGQPAEPFVARDGRVALGPGNRIDLFIDANHDGGTVTPILTGFRDARPVARLVYESGGVPRVTPRKDPPALPQNPLPARIDLKNSLKVELELGSAKLLDPAGAPLFTVRRGRAVTLAIRNLTGHSYVAHLHGHHFRLLDRLDDGWKPYWMDTLVVDEQVERIAFVADNPGKWLIAWRMLEQPNNAAAAWFAVS